MGREAKQHPAAEKAVLATVNQLPGGWCRTTGYSPTAAEAIRK